MTDSLFGFAMDINMLCENLQTARDNVSAEAIAKELRPLLPASELLGLDLKIRVAIERLVPMLNKSPQ